MPTDGLKRLVRERLLDVVSVTVGEVGNGPNRFKSAVQRIASWNARIAENPSLLVRVERAADIAEARSSGRLGIIYNFQDTTQLEGDAANVELFRRLGVRVVQLTYNKRNLAGEGCLEGANGGLSDFGREVIAAIKDAKLVLDLSHAGQRTTAEAIVASKAPPIISHSGCRALVDIPRNARDEEMRALAQKGGVFGLYLMPFLRARGQTQREDLLRHLNHALKICGEDHIGIGTDNSIYDQPIDENAFRQQREFYERRARAGIAAPGEAPDVLNLVDGYHQADRFGRIANDLKQRGWRAGQIDKLLSANFIRLFASVWEG